MSKSDVISKAMILLNENKTLLPGTSEYDALFEQVSSLIDQLGPEKALEQVRRAKSLLLQEVYKDSHWKTDFPSGTATGRITT